MTLTTKLFYDTLDRCTGIVYGAESTVGLFYDNGGRVTNLVDSSAGTIKFNYDPLDNVTLESNAYGSVTYAYNAGGLRTNMTVTGETPVFYTYDAANQLTNVTQGTFTSALSYDAAGRRTNLVLPNGISIFYAYDSVSRLTNITYLGATTNTIGYTYDPYGNRVSQHADAKGVMPVALGVYNLPAAVNTGSYDNANRQTAFGAYSVLYDANGNVTNIISGTTTNQLFWNARNQLTNLLGAVTATFTYDGLGRRVTRTVNGVTEKYLYDGADVILQKDNSGTIGSRYFRGLAVDEPWQRVDVGAGNTNRVYLADGLGSIVGLSDSSKNISNTYTYEAFGTTAATGVSNKNSYQFTGREDDGTGLYYSRARYYHPGLGRFLSEDPLDAGNLYAYCWNNPVNWADRLGLDPLGDTPLKRKSSICNSGGGFDSSSSQKFGAGSGGSGPPMSYNGNASKQGGLNVFERAPSGFSNWTLGSQVHQGFEAALNALYGTEEGDWIMQTMPGQTGVDAKYTGPLSRNPGFKFAELKPYSQNGIDAFGDQLFKWKLAPSTTQLFFYNQAGIIGSSGFNF